MPAPSPAEPLRPGDQAIVEPAYWKVLTVNRPILVTGGSGTLGRGVVARLLAGGHQVRVLSRQPRPVSVPAQVDWVTGELVSGQGLAAAVAGTGVIVHCASDPRRRQVDIDGTRNLLGAARAVGTPHLLYISIVGIDRLPYRYYQAKLATERLIQASGLPWTILRATQFHQLLLLVARGLARLPLVPVPAATSFQPIDAAEVAHRLAALAGGPPAGRVPDLGGPEVRTAADLLRAYLQATGRRRLVLAVQLPGAVFAGHRHGGHLAPDRAVGRRTWEQFLTAQLGHPRPTGADRTTAERRA
jgi:uncharacterized protein YbjT (DUF2867 family)